MNKHTTSILCKTLAFLLCLLSWWVVTHLWNERTCSARYFSDQQAIDTYYQETIWRLKNLARESINTLSLLHSQQVQLEIISQDFELIKAPNSRKILQRRKQDCYTCGSSISSVRKYTSAEYTPHLLLSDMNMTPLRRVGLGKSGYKLVFGIPTVERGEKYLFQTLSSLLDPQGYPEHRRALFIVFVAELNNSSYCQDVIDEILQSFDYEVQSGILEIICPNPTSYPPLSHLPQTLSDQEDRLYWRSKQVLDYSFLMWYAATKGDYYIQLEDDVIGARGYLQHIQSYVDSSDHENSWLIINFSLLGFIGKLFRAADLAPLIQYMLLFYYRQPVDWLLSNYLRDMMCFLGQAEEECADSIAQSSPVFMPSLFQHIGTTSSLKGKVQELVDIGFDDFLDNMNPPAYLSTVFRTFDTNTLSKVYLGQGYFWGMSVQVNDSLTISLIDPQVLISICVVTGGEAGRNDILSSGQIEYNTGNNQDFLLLCILIEGVANCEFPKNLIISQIRILATMGQAQWLIISELTVKSIHL